MSRWELGIAGVEDGGDLEGYYSAMITEAPKSDALSREEGRES